MRKNKIVGRRLAMLMLVLLASSTLMAQQKILKGKITDGNVKLKKDANESVQVLGKAPHLLLNDGVTNLSVVLT